MHFCSFSHKIELKRSRVKIYIENTSLISIPNIKMTHKHAKSNINVYKTPLMRLNYASTLNKSILLYKNFLI